MTDVLPQTERDPWMAFLEQGLLGSAPLVANAPVTVRAEEIGGVQVPVVTNDSGAARIAWVASLRNAYGPYARTETRIVKLPRLARAVGLAASWAGEGMLVAGGFSGGCFVDNWLLSTNLLSPALTAGAFVGARERLVAASPHQPIVWRSLTPALHGELLRELAAAGFQLWPTRQIWLVRDPASGAWRRHRDAKKDLKLAHDSAEQWRWVRGEEFSAEDFRRARELYQQLYRSRYPNFNPDYTEAFLRIGVTTRFLELFGLRPARGGPLVSVVGMVHRGGVSATPIVGYDLAMPVAAGLYRLLSLKIWETAERRGTLLHCSAGAGAFKKSRGAERAVEYAAVWTHHLPPARRAMLDLMAAALRHWAVPFLSNRDV